MKKFLKKYSLSTPQWLEVLQWDCKWRLEKYLWVIITTTNDVSVLFQIKQEIVTNNTDLETPQAEQSIEDTEQIQSVLRQESLAEHTIVLDDGTMGQLSDGLFCYFFYLIISSEFTWRHTKIYCIIIKNNLEIGIYTLIFYKN